MENNIMIKVNFNILSARSRVFISMYRYILILLLRIFLLYMLYVFHCAFYNYSNVMHECIKKETRSLLRVYNVCIHA